MGWLADRARRRHQAQLDAVTQAFGLDDPELVQAQEAVQARDSEIRETIRANRAAVGLGDTIVRGMTGGCTRSTASVQLSAARYRAEVTGTPADVAYRLEGPEGATYDFDGFEDPYLVWTVPDDKHELGRLETQLGTADLSSFLEAAATQSVVAQCAPIRWYVQHPRAGWLLVGLLRDAGLTEVQVVVRTPWDLGFRLIEKDAVDGSYPRVLAHGTDGFVSPELPAEQYRAWVTGTAEGVRYHVVSPRSARRFDFDGFGDERLIWTVASYEDRFGGALPEAGASHDAVLEVVRAQQEASHGTPTRWYVQRVVDAQRLAVVLRDAGFSSIEVLHLPVPPSTHDGVEDVPEDSVGHPMQPGPEPEPMLSQARYKEWHTGSPEGVGYLVRDPDTGLRFVFDGADGDVLIWTVADFRTRFDGTDGSPARDGDDEEYLEAARLQDSVRQGHPIRWLVQSEKDARRLAALVRSAGFPALEIVHAPAR